MKPLTPRSYAEALSIPPPPVLQNVTVFGHIAFNKVIRT